MILVIILMISSLLTGYVAYYSKTKDLNNKMSYLSSVLMLASLWTITELFLIISPNLLKYKLWITYFEYIPITFLPVFWLLFAYKYVKNVNLLKFKKSLLLFLIPIITILMNITNKYHLLLKKDVKLVNFEQFSNIESVYGPFFWISMLYSYTALLAGTIIILSKLLKNKSIFKKQGLIIGIGILVPFLGNIIFIFKLVPRVVADLTPILFGVSGILFYIGISYYKLFDVVPLARDNIVENMDDAIIVADLKGKIVDINKAAYRKLINVNHSIVGEHVVDIINEHILKEIKINSLQELGYIIRVEKDEEELIFQCYIKALKDETDEKVGIVITLKDITMFEETINQLKKAMAEAEEANSIKSKFLATITHEIRTPINGIFGMCLLLEKTDLNTEQQLYLSNLSSSSKHLLNIVNDILDFSKLEFGKMELEKIEFNIYSLMDEIYSNILVQEKGWQVIVNVDKQLPKILIGDPVRLKQVIYNLTNNAMKFTKDGMVKVKVTQKSKDNEKVKILIEVIDSGIGIPEDKIDKLFNSFEQLDSRISREYGGTGLGLSIVHSIIMLMNGSIKVTSKVGEGSNFRIDIELKYLDDIKGTKEDNQDFEKEAKIMSIPAKNKILIVEDNKTNQLFISTLIKKQGYEFDKANNGKEAYEQYLENEYSLILMDLQMPVMDGFEATIKIREYEKETGKKIPIIALTANTSEDEVQKVFDVNMDAYLSKPFEPKALFEKINEFLVKE
jgi:PAS domain S-box-containing protein